MGKNLPADAGDSDLIPGSGRSPGGGNANPLQYSCGGIKDTKTWKSTVREVTKSRDMAKVIEYVPLFHLESFGGIYKGNGWMASLIQWTCV